MEKKLTLQLIEKEEDAEGVMVEISLIIIKEYFGCIYDMWESIGEGCQLIPIYIYQQGFTVKEFRSAINIVNELYLYACERRKQDVKFIYNSFLIRQYGLDHFFTDNLTDIEIINLTRLFENYSGYEPILTCMKSKIISIYEHRSIFDIMYHATPFMYDTKGNRAWLREMSGDLKNKILLPYVHELRFISAELTGINTSEVSQILQHYLYRRARSSGRLVNGYNIKPVFFSGCNRSLLNVHEYVYHDFRMRNTIYFPGRDSRALIGINDDICEDYTGSYYGKYSLNICTNNRDNIFKAAQNKIITDGVTRSIRMIEPNQIITAVSNEEYVVYLTTDEKSNNLHIIPIKFPSSRVIPVIHPNIGDKIILIASSPNFFYYVNTNHYLYRRSFKNPQKNEEKLGKHVIQISSGISFLIHLKKDSLLQFCQHENINYKVNIPYEGRMITFISTSVGCLFHTTTGIYVAVIEEMEIKKIDRMPFSNTVNTPPLPFVSNFMPIISKKKKRDTKKDLGEPNKRIKLG